MVLNQHVLRFKVTMEETMFVHVGQPSKRLVHDVSDLVFSISLRIRLFR
jgi:hypothetical protein